MDKRLRTFGALAVAALSLVWVLGVSHAQYPPPAGGLTLESDETTATPEGDTLLTCRVFEADGTPIAGTACTFKIVSEPGTDAEVGSKEITKVTDENGVATTMLRVGTTSGVIVVEASSGEFVSNVLVTVDDAPAPPQSLVGNITPPATGDGGLAH